MCALNWKQRQQVNEEKSMMGRKASANKTFKGNMIPRETPTDTNCVRTKPHSILKEYEETQCGRRRKATGSRECPLAEGLWSPSRYHVGLGTHCGEQSAWHFCQLRQEQNEIASVTFPFLISQALICISPSPVIPEPLCLGSTTDSAPSGVGGCPGCDACKAPRITGSGPAKVCTEMRNLKFHKCTVGEFLSWWFCMTRPLAESVFPSTVCKWWWPPCKTTL